MTDEELFALIRSVDQRAQRVPPGIREIAEALIEQGRREAREELLKECAPYLKEGETPAQRIKREFDDAQALLGLLAKARAERDAAIEALNEKGRESDGQL